MGPPRGIENDLTESRCTMISEPYAASPLPDVKPDPQLMAAGNAPVDEKYPYTEYPPAVSESTHQRKTHSE